MAWVQRDRYCYSCGGARGVPIPEDGAVARVVDAMEISFPPTMDELAIAKQVLRELARPGDEIDVTYTGRFDLVLATFRGRDGLGWSIEICGAHPREAAP